MISYVFKNPLTLLIVAAATIFAAPLRAANVDYIPFWQAFRELEMADLDPKVYVETGDASAALSKILLAVPRVLPRDVTNLNTAMKYFSVFTLAEGTDFIYLNQMGAVNRVTVFNPFTDKNSKTDDQFAAAVHWQDAETHNDYYLNASIRVINPSSDEYLPVFRFSQLTPEMAEAKKFSAPVKLESLDEKVAKELLLTRLGAKLDDLATSLANPKPYHKITNDSFVLAVSRLRTIFRGNAEVLKLIDAKIN